MTAAEVLRIFISIYPLLKNERVSSKLIPYKALISYTMTHA
jgi:hypothetical protein